MATAVNGEKRNSLGKDASNMTKRAAAHQQAIRLNHARQSVVYIRAQVENNRHPDHVEDTRPGRAARTAHVPFGAVLGHLRGQTPWILNVNRPRAVGIQLVK